MKEYQNFKSYYGLIKNIDLFIKKLSLQLIPDLRKVIKNGNSRHVEFTPIKVIA